MRLATTGPMPCHRRRPAFAATMSASADLLGLPPATEMAVEPPTRSAAYARCPQPQPRGCDEYMPTNSATTTAT